VLDDPAERLLRRFLDDETPGARGFECEREAVGHHEEAVVVRLRLDPVTLARRARGEPRRPVTLGDRDRHGGAAFRCAPERAPAPLELVVEAGVHAGNAEAPRSDRQIPGALAAWGSAHEPARAEGDGRGHGASLPTAALQSPPMSRID